MEGSTQIDHVREAKKQVWTAERLLDTDQGIERHGDAIMAGLMAAQAHALLALAEEIRGLVSLYAETV